MYERMLDDWLSLLHPVGAGTRGVTRTGYTDAEDEMHSLLRSFALELGLDASEDSFGNTLVSLPAAGARPRFLIGSHLDSVPEGGRYDGVAGVLAGLLVMSMSRDEGVDLPLATVAFRSEETSAFGPATIGSLLFTGAPGRDSLLRAKDSAGRSLRDAIKERGFSPDAASAPLEAELYLELHIEQGRVLESSGVRLGVVSAIAGAVRFRAVVEGRQDHSGATPMGMRSDSLCAAAEAVLAAERCGTAESALGTVATVGVIRNEPNAMNVVPGRTALGVDVRGTDERSFRRTADVIKAEMAEICRRRGVSLSLEEVAASRPVAMDPEVMTGLSSAAERMGIDYMVMPSGAGHDAMNIAPHLPTGMLFIPCRDGVSHNPDEHADTGDIVLGARVLYEYLRGRK